MLKINLLPFGLTQKKEKILKQLYVFFFMILLMVILMISYTWFLNNQILLVQGQNEELNRQIKIHKEKTDRIAKIKTDIKVFEDKLSIISALNSRKRDIFMLFNSMSELVVPERMWLESFKSEPDGLIIKGIAFDNPSIAEFMENLEKSTLFTKVDLKSAKIKTFQGDSKLKIFELKCSRNIENN
jgi:type IV pilus assembly protein PilN